MLHRKEVLSETSYHIETHINVVAEFIEVQSSFSFDFCLDEEFIEFLWDDLMFQSPHATKFLYWEQSNGGDLLLSMKIVVGSGGFGEYF